MAIDMSQFYQVFFEESAEHLTSMESLLLDLDIERPDMEQLNAIFRAAHSIKGSAGTFGFSDLAETTHVLENLLDRIRKQELSLRPEMVDAFLACGDLLREMLEAHQGRGTVDPQAAIDICDRLRVLSSDSGKKSSATSNDAAPQYVQHLENEACDAIAASGKRRVFDIQFVPTEISAKGDGVANLLDSFREMGELEILNQPDPDLHHVGFWQLRLITSASPDVFSEHIDFIADNGAWRVSEDSSVEPNGTSAFGFFDEAPGMPDEERGYGFFDSFGERGVCENSADLEASGGAEGFGFFEPLPDAKLLVQNNGGADDSYGFFEPVAPAVGHRQSGIAEEGDGFGFFESLSASPALQSGDDISPPVSVAVAPPPGTKATVAAENRVRANKPAQGVGAGDSSIRVSVEKVDQLINLVGELVITQAMLLQTTVQMQESAPERLINGLAQLERNTRDLQEAVMSIRMMPISFVFSRFPRVVRDLSGKLGKQVELKTSGETTELDKSLIERITDPLTHLIRNSLDHGIESPDQRVAAGKSPVGTITLKAYHQGGNIVIEVGDDGAGLPRNKILAKARERGLNVSDLMSDAEVFNLIFEAGFSTAEQVTDVSGRGVGMDVVRRNISEMGGRIEIESMLGVGTRMTVRLPLTLAILDGMSVAVGDQTYILPLSYVIESLQPQAGDIKTLSNQARVIQVRGEYLPVIVLHEIFNIKSAWNGFYHGIMVVLDADGTRAALFVDELVGQHQVVIKSLEANYRRVPGVSGATIMGDGHVALILDVSAIAGMAKSSMQKAG